MVGPLELTFMLALSSNPCVEEAKKLPPEERAILMCGLAEENKRLRAIPCPTCPPPTPPEVRQENDWLELLGAGVVGGVIVGVAWLATSL